MHYDVIVIGGGASGLMAAGAALAQGKRVCILEKNAAVGAKLSITGGGRCNITNATDDIHTLLAQYGTAAPFLYSPFSQFGVSHIFDFFTQRGLPLVIQARQRVFPYTENARDVVAVMKQYCQGAVIHTQSTVSEIVHDADMITGVRVGNIQYTAASYILATGGVSHPETGSTGDGFTWLRALGHTVVTPTPTIVPLRTTDAWGHSLSGVSLSFMRISFFVEGKRAFSLVGKVLFTHFGISGPLILNASSRVWSLLQEGTVTATIDLYPDTDIGTLDTRIVHTFERHKNKLLKTILKEILPDGMVPGVIQLIDPVLLETPVHSITKEQRRMIVHLCKALPLTIIDLMGYDRAVIADGGVPLTEIDTKKMVSKKYKNLFITGDLLHINRPSGGYSLQLCWTTGYVAGIHA